MEQKAYVCGNKGMVRDISISKGSNEYAYENHNIRITANEGETFLSLTNERGNIELSIKDDSDVTIPLKGIVIGSAVINSYLVLFTAENIKYAPNSDSIYILEYKDTYFRLVHLYIGNFNFKSSNPIETLVLYESEDVQKVYWVDGLNQPRVINIKKNYTEGTSSTLVNPSVFDFITEYKGGLLVNIDKSYANESYFTDGTIQYLFTYSNKFGQETNIVTTTPLYYLSKEDRGVSSEERSNCNFTLTLENIDNSFDYINIYSLIKASNYSANKVVSIEIDKSNKDKTYTYLDLGNYSNSIDPTILYYIGGRSIIASTISQKDNTLFLGDLKLKTNIVLEVPDATKNLLYDKNGISKCVTFVEDAIIPYYEPYGYYPYVNQLNYNSEQIKGFKGGNTYRFAVRFKNNKGEYSAPIWLGDVTNTIYPKIKTLEIGGTNTTFITKAKAQCVLPDSLKTLAFNSGYTYAELMIAEPSNLNRTVVAQGIINPTVFNLEQRNNGSVYSESSWFTRCRNSNIANSHFESIHTNSIDSGEIQCLTEDVPPYFNTKNISDYLVKHKYQINLEKGFTSNAVIKEIGYYSNDIEKGVEREYRTSKVIISQGTAMASEIIEKLYNLGYTANAIPSKSELANNIVDSAALGRNKIYPLNTEYIEEVYSKYTQDAGTNYSRAYKNNYYVDESIVTLNSPDINEESLNGIDTSELKFRIVGLARITSNISDFNLKVDNPYSTTSLVSSLSFSSPYKGLNIDSNIDGLISFPIYKDSYFNWNGDTLNAVDGVYKIYPWHKTGSIIGYKDDTAIYSKLNSKVFANLKYSYDTNYIWGNNAWTPKEGIGKIRIYSGDNVNLQLLEVDGNPINYQGNYDYTLTSIASENELEDTGYNLYLSKSVDITNKENLENVTDIQEYNKDKFKCYDPVRIQYKSPIHAVFSFNNYIQDNKLYINTLPKIAYMNEGNLTVDNNFETIDSKYALPWNNELNIKEEMYSLLPSYYNSITKECIIEVSNSSYENNILTINNKIGTLDLYNELYLESSTNSVIITPAKAYKISSVNYDKNSIPIVSKLEITEKDNNNLFLTINFASKVPLFTISFPDISHTFNTIDYNLKLDIIKLSTSSVEHSITKTISINKAKEDIMNTVTFNIGDYITKDSIENYTFRLTRTIGDSLIATYNAKEYKLSRWFNLDTQTLIEGTWADLHIKEGIDYNLIFKDTCKYKLGATLITEDFSFLNIFEEPPIIYNYSVESGSYISSSTNSFSIENNINSYPVANGNINEVGSDAWYSRQPYLFIGELYRDTAPYKDFNSISEETFIPCGPCYDFSNTNILEGKEGDTYFQRYDCIKTLPLKEGAENSVIDIVSFMVETYQNIEGRYDNRRGNQNIASTTKENFNLFNPYYTQNRNFFSSSVLDKKFELTSFPNQITWTKQKINTELVDTWTNITLASILDLDGDKGKINAIRRFNNTLYVFQDKGIAEILFNSRTQLSTVQGVPIEIANSGKVEGKRYITEKAGCTNKWSILETTKGIYFIDSLNTSISRLGQGIESLSDNKGFRYWLSQNNSIKEWNPKDFNNFITYYDKTNDDVYFTNKETSLCYNELLEEFISFYDYGSTLLMDNIDNSFIAIKGNKLWKQFEGNFTELFGETKDFYSIYKVNPSPYSDKLFTNIEIKADFFNQDTLVNETFDTLEVYNEYQTTGNINLDNTTSLIKHSYPDIREKFRTWRVNIPRAVKSDSNPYGLDRIRNPWIYLKIGKSGTNYKSVLHNLIVKYFE